MAPENLFNNRQWRPRRPSTLENGDRPGLSVVPPWAPPQSRVLESLEDSHSNFFPPTDQARFQWGLQQKTSTSGGSALQTLTGTGRDARPSPLAARAEPSTVSRTGLPCSLPGLFLCLSPAPSLRSPCGISSEIRSIAGLSRLRYPQQSGNGVDEPQRWRNAPSPVAGRVRTHLPHRRCRDDPQPRDDLQGPASWPIFASFPLLFMPTAR
ncbi:hypothetical protein F5144DRAFT_138996 [Chaetomium tenue]|uniref:Uncharacterized protein n=1 Tax=Chaetomium tenue TaxID=1854479 RepID=A0ACB7PIB9_9PEZI|nr:hypothetical protein F5144DRAFT_138996 [Chaetomium globosum]